MLHFIDDVHVIKDNLFPIPPLFNMIQKASKTSWNEMYRVFNMGHRLEVFTHRDKAELLMEAGAALGIDAKIVGRVEESVSKQLILTTDKETIEFNF